MYAIRLTKSSREFLRQVPGREAERILRELYALRENPFRSNLRKLKGYKLWRMKIDEHRAIVDILISAKELIVLAIGHRRNVYREFFGKRRRGR